MKKAPRHRWMSLWRHFFHREKTADLLTDAMIEWQEKWRWDFLKLNPPACYHVLDWGAEYRFFEDPLREPELLNPIVLQAVDVANVHPLDVHRGVLGDQLEVIRRLRAHFGPELPIVETVFSPIEIAHRMMKGRDALTRLRRESPAAVHSLLEMILETFRKFCLACLEAGADGIFFATKWAASDRMTWHEYEEFGKKYELTLLRDLREKDALIILHVCGERTYLEKMLDYPVDIFSYDFHAEGAPAPEDVLRRTGAFVLGGVDPVRLRSDVRGVIADCSSFAGLDHWLIGPSCVVPPDVPDSAIDLLKKELCSSL